MSGAKDRLRIAKTCSHRIDRDLSSTGGEGQGGNQVGQNAESKEWPSQPSVRRRVKETDGRRADLRHQCGEHQEDRDGELSGGLTHRSLDELDRRQEPALSANDEKEKDDQGGAVVRKSDQDHKEGDNDHRTRDTDETGHTRVQLTPVLSHSPSNKGRDRTAKGDDQATPSCVVRRGVAWQADTEVEQRQEVRQDAGSHDLHHRREN
mmetsp:Transcript_27500/g.72446  ORF Transcript_27500/g.72446 Transcript_27500/m.72446 type:complete len:207 (+) Transcript_27500:279-899(+)